MHTHANTHTYVHTRTQTHTHMTPIQEPKFKSKTEEKNNISQKKTVPSFVISLLYCSTHIHAKKYFVVAFGDDTTNIGLLSWALIS